MDRSRSASDFPRRVALLALALLCPQTSGPLAQELTSRDRAEHVLQRLAFGPRPGDVDRVLQEGIERWIARQLEPSRIDDSTLEQFLARWPVLTADVPSLRRDFPTGLDLRREATRRAMADSGTRQEPPNGRALVVELSAARIARAIASERQLEEVLVDFWLNHFSVFAGKNQQMRYYLPSWERDVIRVHAMGQFRALLGAVAHSAAMLTYLDNAISVADSTQPTLVDPRTRRRREQIVQRRVRAAQSGARDSATAEALLARRPRGINENYARELMELHTLGVDGGYSQQDVTEMARILTGWGVNRATGQFQFNAAGHDAGPKRLLGTSFPAGRGVAEGEAALDLLAAHPATARHIATKLAVRFVADTPSADVVDAAAAVFRETGGDIRAVVRSIVTSPEFFSRAAWRTKVKSPFELATSTVRALGGVPDSTRGTVGILARLGQPIYGHQAPDGWPETGAEWMNTGAILNRINFGMAVAARRVPGADPRAWPAFRELASAPPDHQVDGIIRLLLGGRAAPETREVLRSGRNPLARPDAAQGAPGRRLTAFETTIGLALGSPEFQRR